jgi:hypothetical protein
VHSGKKNPFYGKQHDIELKKLMSAKTNETLKSKRFANIPIVYWWYNGMINKRGLICPDETSVRGKIKKV